MPERKNQPLEALTSQRQSIWMDFLDRDLITSGGLKRLRDEFMVSGLTSNPTIFEKAISGSDEYDDSIRAFLLKDPHADPKAIYEKLAIEDLQQAADLLRPVFDRSGGTDGFVSLEVSPGPAHDTQGTIAEARHLWKSLSRPNVMIKVPATAEGMPAIEQLIADGINVNITLMFSLSQYVQVAQAYIRGLERRSDPRNVASVASFFVSRVDTKVDRALQEIGTKEALALRGRIAIGNSRLVYRKFKEVFGYRFDPLKERGAHLQKPLWASTSTKNPSYRDVLYVEELIGPDTVNTMPPATLHAFADHGQVRGATVMEGDPESDMKKLAELGINLSAITDELLKEGIEDFAKSFRNLLSALDRKRKLLLSGQFETQSGWALGRHQDALEKRLQRWKEDDFISRIWRKDPSLWSSQPDTPELANRLGWLDLPREMKKEAGAIARFAKEIKDEDYRHVVLLGMGGSSLAPEVFQATCGNTKGHPKLVVVDTTHPDAIRQVSRKIDPVKTLFLVSSKSGTTIETLSLFSYFWQQVNDRSPKPGRNFVAITDPGTSLVQTARERGFRHIFSGPEEVGGRYSALSVFGLVPAALIGVNVERLLERAWQMADACGNSMDLSKNPGARLGAVLGELGLAGRDKITFVTSPAFSALPLWIEQLIAESTGKNGRGLVPVAGERLGSPGIYGDDRLFVGISLARPGDRQSEELQALQRAGFPVLTLALNEIVDLGQEFFRWEFATAAAGAILEINPFDQPDVQLAKDLAKKAMESGAARQKDPDELSIDERPALSEALRRWTESIRPGDYIALQAYLAETPETNARLESLRSCMRDRFHVATTLGYGPRFLHSTGQLHKGGPNNGVFLQLTDKPAEDLPVPEKSFTFGSLIRAQAEGDYQALKNLGRRIIRINLGDNAPAAIADICQFIAS